MKMLSCRVRSEKMINFRSKLVLIKVTYVRNFESVFTYNMRSTLDFLTLHTKNEEAESFFIFPPIVPDGGLQTCVKRFKINTLSYV